MSYPDNNNTSNLPSWVTFFLFFLVGTPGWMLVNALYLQLPILMIDTPESYGIAAYLVVGIQFGNLLGFFCAILQSYTKLRSPSLIIVILLFTLAVDVLLGLKWESTVEIGGKERSIWLLVLLVCSGGIGSLSTVVMYPFASVYGTLQITGLSTGMGLNGFFLSLLALLQSPGLDQERFGVSMFFYILLSVIILSIVALFVILLLERRTVKVEPLDEARPEEERSLKITEEEEEEESTRSIITSAIYPIINQAYISIMNYIVLGLSSYVVTGYTNDSSLIFWLTFLGVLFGAIGRFATLKFSISNLNLITLIQVMLFSYVVVLGFLQHKELHEAWGWSTVAANALFMGLYGFADTTNYNNVCFLVRPSSIERTTRFVGVSNQVGACIGSLVAFALVMFYFEA
eukprot:TRINITY_DN10088_c0_g1_i2.p1 TRINITY_DN10088_c0_g1~~TRINITY_DN10088_c0_g1_i2.p1  ORF type:complete len:402 (-),score=51.76 TRINITY_DN10088_c0_g1_i2:83-1288(-)